MPDVLNRTLYKTCTLRSQRQTFDTNDVVVTKPMGRFTTHRDFKKINSYPQPGWADDYEKTGVHLSRRMWKGIRGSHKRPRWRVHTKQERRFRYNPAIPWDENPAFFDNIIEYETDI